MEFTNISYIYFFAIAINVCIGKKLHEEIYSSIEGGAPCYRRLNGTHQVGCSSSHGGAVGVVHMVQNISDAQWIVYNASAGPYMAIVNTVLFYDIIELFMSKHHNVAGILLYDDPSIRPNAFSQESRCPNEYSAGPGSKCSSNGGIVWNEMGTDLLRRDIPFPIFFLPQPQVDEIHKLEQCFKKYNSDLNNQKGQPLCSLQMSSFMYAATNSAVCLRRSASSALFTSTKFCDPLGDFNIYYSLFSRAKEEKKQTKPVILVTARIDSASLFDGVAPGAASSVVGLVTHIAAAVALSKMIPITDEDLYEKNVLWTLFNGEAFDYIGSQRVAYDIGMKRWPPIASLSPEDINLHIELGQIGGSFELYKDSPSWPLYAYAPYTNDSISYAQVNEFINEMNTYASQNNITITPKFDSNLPPSSLHSFRKILSNATSSGALPELLIVDHNETFTNRFYHSVLDNHENIGFVYHNISIGSDGKFLSTNELLASGIMKDTEAQVKIARVATALVQTLYQQVTGKPYTGDVAASAHLVDEMLYCFLRSQSCRLLAAVEFSTEDAGENPASRYVGVAGNRDSPASQAGFILALLTGYPLFVDKIACNKNNEEMLEREQSKKTQTKKAMPLYVGSAARAGAPTWRTGLVLALLTGTSLTLDRTACNKYEEPGFLHYWLSGWNHTGVCIRSTMNFTQAISPAFDEQGYNPASEKFSTWTESVWLTMWARVFVQASGQGAKLAAVTGAIATIAVAVLTYWIRKHSEIIFADAPVSVRSDGTGIIRTVNC